VPLVASCVATVLHVAHLLGVLTASYDAAPGATYASLTSAAAAAASSSVAATAARGASAGSVEVGSPLAQARRLLQLGDHAPNGDANNNTSNGQGGGGHNRSDRGGRRSHTYAATMVTLSGDADDDCDDESQARSCGASVDRTRSSLRGGAGSILSPLNRGFATVQGVAFHLLCRAAADTNCRSAMDFKALLQACQEDLALLLAMQSSSGDSSPLSTSSTSTHSGSLSPSSPGSTVNRRNSGSRTTSTTTTPATGSRKVPPPYALFSELPQSVAELWARAQLLPQRRSGYLQHLTCAQGLLSGNSKRGHGSGKPSGRRVAWCVLAAGRLRVYDRAAAAAASTPGSTRNSSRSSFSRSSSSLNSSNSNSTDRNAHDTSSSRSSGTEAKAPMGSATAVLGTLPLGEFLLFPTARITTAPDDPCRVQISDCGGDLESDTSLHQPDSPSSQGRTTRRKSFWRSSPARPPSLEFTCGSEGEAEKWCVAFTEHVALLLLASDRAHSTYFQVTGRLPIASSALCGGQGNGGAGSAQ